jgi:hypothetical protein
MIKKAQFFLAYKTDIVSSKLMIFTRVALHTKSKGLLISGPLFSKGLGFLHA